MERQLADGWTVDRKGEGSELMKTYHNLLSNEDLLTEYKRCVRVLCREVLNNETNKTVELLKIVEKELLERMK